MGIAGTGKILAMTREEILQAFDRMRVWQRSDQRAMHKRLLVLFALAKVGAGDTAIMAAHQSDFARPYGAFA